MSYHHALLSAASKELDGPEKKAKLFELAQKIMEELQPAIDQVYEKIGHWKETGQLPPEGTAEDGIKRQRRILSIRSSISRYKKMIRETEDPERKDWLMAKIRALEEDL